MIEDHGHEEEERAQEKVINEGIWTIPGTPCWVLMASRRVQDVEEECSVPLRHDSQHGVRMADSDYAMAS